ncbi:MAG: SusC/RagA family TonB-linked outer membrane protein [Runella sp.]
MQNLFFYRQKVFQIGWRVLCLILIAAEAQAVLPPQKSTVLTVSGTVRGESDGLPGVSVVLKGTSLGTVTDANGKYSLSIEDGQANGTLVFSYIGYVSQEIPLNRRLRIDVVLLPDTKSLNEVVVIGYGEQSRRDVTGSVVSISAKQLENVPVAGLDQALAGQLAGVQVQETTGAPGGTINVRVRGSGSIGAGNEPLYVVDGFPGVTNLNAINPNDIQSIEVLKDASAAAIYGSRGANGVVIITTKQGRTGKTTFKLDSYTGVQQVLRKLDLLNATEYAEHFITAKNNIYRDAGGITDFTRFKNSQRPIANQILPLFLTNDSSNVINPALGVGTDWQDAIYRAAPVRNIQLTATGGSERVRFAVTGGYFNQQGIILNSGFERFSTRLNLDANLTPKLKLGLNLAPSLTRRKIVNSDDTWSREGIVMTAITISPHIPVQNPDGTYPGQYQLGTPGFNAMINPVAIATQFNQREKELTNTGRLFLNWNPVVGLTAQTSVGVNTVTSAFNSYYPSYLGRGGSAPPSLARAEARSSMLINWVNTNTLTYNRTFAQKHNLTALIGNEVQKEAIENTFVRGEKFSSDAAPFVGAAGQITGGSGSLSEWSLVSYFGRITYDYTGKYLLTFNIRRDGSSRFGPNYKWGTFPSASAGWQVMEEPFMKPLKNHISTLKFRASYGYGGNNNIGNYAYQGLLSDQNYVLGPGLGELVTGLAPATLVNPDLRWETSQQGDIGVDAGLWNDRLQLTVDYYNKLTRDLLLNVNVPRLTGYQQILTNIGRVRNWGWEFAANARILTGKKGLEWNTSFNISFNRNRVLALGPNGDRILAGTSQIFESHIVEVGKPLGNFYGYKVLGVFNTQDEINAAPRWTSGPVTRPGDYRFQDTNNDGLINAADRTVLGNAFPDYIFGITNNFRYRGIELSFLIQGNQGNEVINGTRRFMGTLTVGNNQYRKIVQGSWKSPENPGTGYARQGGSTNNNVNMNSTWVEDGSFVRIRTVTIAYNLPSNLLKPIGLRNLRIYGLMQNPFMFSNYLGYNPDVSFSGRAVLNPGVDYGGYPLARTTTFGVTVDF